MEREEALVTSLFFFVLFGLLIHYGAQINWWSSLALATLLALILLNIFYPPSQVTSDEATASLAVYMILEVVGIILLLIYIIERSLRDVTCCTS